MGAVVLAIAIFLVTFPASATYSILGFDSETGEIGGAVQSRVFSVGNGVLWAEAGIGVVATQAIVDVSYGPKGLELLRQGFDAEEILNRLRTADADPRPEPWPKGWPKSGRQAAVIDAKGNVAAFTGPDAPAWSGHRLGKYCTAQGNILVSERVVAEMVDAFERTEGPLALRLLTALEAGQAAGGDKRGQQSAALIVVKKGGGRWLNNDVVLRIQIDDSSTPLVELRRLVDLWKSGRRN